MFGGACAAAVGARIGGGGGGPAFAVGAMRPESDARSSVAARLSSSARADKPACVAASTARLSQTMASYFSP
jgi:hypothetical protein